MFKKNKLSVAVMAALAPICSQTIMAQEDQAELEEVVVVGIRASAEASMDIKRDSAGVVDAISAEDIGKFPDSNLAESLQRITGVSIDRRNGEGYQVTVRGFGPEFNLVTLNGRSMPTSQLNSTNGGPRSSRTFDMSNIASEGVSAVEVYKTGKANMSSGGIGATVNLKTRRPFDNAGLKFSVGAKAVRDTTVRIGDEWTPELSGFLSWSDDKFGASVAYSRQERESANSGVFSNNWSDYSGAWTDASFLEGIPYENGQLVTSPGATRATDVTGYSIDPEDVRVVNAPAVGQQANNTPGFRYHHGDYYRKRENTQITLQYRPIDRLTATLDYTSAEQVTFINSAELSFWFGGGAFPATDVQFDGHPQAATPVYFWTENPAYRFPARATDAADSPLNQPQDAVRDIGITQNQGHYQNNLYSTGFNLEFLASDELTLTLDAHKSYSESTPGDGSIANYINIALGAQGNWAQGYDNSGDLPLLVAVYEDDHRDGSGSDGILENQLDLQDVGSTVRQIYNDRAWGEISQIKLDGKWEFSDSGAINFGVETSSMEATQRRSDSQIVLEGNWGVGTPGDVPVDMVEEIDYADLFDGYSTTLSAESREFFNNSGISVDHDNDPSTPNVNSGQQAEVLTKGWIAKDTAALGRYLSYNAGLEWAANPNDGTNRTIKEDITSLYLQGSYELEFMGMPLNILGGVRYEQTDVESIGQVAPSTILWQGDNDLISQSGDASQAPVEIGTGSYSHLLPSLDVAWHINDDMIVRYSLSKTIARNSYDQLLQGINGVQPPVGGPTILGGNPGLARNGNPGLKPLESNNADISFEWYYDDANYASIGFFSKDVPNFVGTAVDEVFVENVLDPTKGPRAEAAVAAIEADPNIALNQQNLFAMIASMNLDPRGCSTSYGAGEDATNSAHCGGDFGSYQYEGTAGWEDNVDIVAVADGEYADPASFNRMRYPVDNQSAKLGGMELAVQHFFGETGFGVLANYTFVDGDIEFDVGASPTETQFALTGLSDSANLVLMYENFGWSARVAYNWRDEFLVNTAAANNEPEHVEAYSQIDFNIGYNITEDFSVSLEGINITEEDSRRFARTQRQLTRLDILGARYALSARYSF